MSGLGPGSELSGFLIESVAGRGGMGVVYRARQLRPERTVALKVIAPELSGDGDFRTRFEREAQVAAQIEHPNVIPVYAVGEEQGVLFIAMRYIVGTDLRDLIGAEGRLDPMRAATLADQVAQALDAAHAHGLVHRDVKPSNVLISNGGREHAYLTDFGLARHVTGDGGVTASGVLVGTIDYIAPEQVRGDPVDARTDVYSLGCMLFETLTGRVPFPSDNDLAKLYAHSTKPPPSARALAPELPAAFDAVLQRAMAKDPAERFPSAGDLGRAAIAAASSTAMPRAAERSVASGAAAPVIVPDTPTAPATPTVTLPGPRRRWPLFAGIGAALVAVAVAAVLLLGGGGDGGGGGGDKQTVMEKTAKTASGRTWTVNLSVPKGAGTPLTMTLSTAAPGEDPKVVESRELPNPPYDYGKASSITEFTVDPQGENASVDLSWYVKPGEQKTKTCYFTLSGGGIQLDSCT